MRKISLILMALGLVLVLGACNREATETDAPSTDNPPVDTPSSDNPPAENPDTSGGASDFIMGLAENEYDGLVVTVTPQEGADSGYAAGAAIPLEVTIENTGDKTITYVQGSGSFSTPQALWGSAEHLQYVTPEDNLGIATMDYRVLDLAPGDTLSFTLYFMAIEPNENFKAYTHEQYSNNQTYIANMTWEALEGAYEDLVATATGSHTGSIYLRYSVVGEGSQSVVTGNPTGYVKADFNVEII